MSTIKVNTVTKRTGSTLTLGESGTTVTLACGATQTGFGRTGTVRQLKLHHLLLCRAMGFL